MTRVMSAAQSQFDSEYEMALWMLAEWTIRRRQHKACLPQEDAVGGQGGDEEDANEIGEEVLVVVAALLANEIPERLLHSHHRQLRLADFAGIRRFHFKPSFEAKTMNQSNRSFALTWSNQFS